MDIQLYEQVPGYVMKPTMMFAYPTCIADVYTPTIEHIYLPEEHSPAVDVQIRVATGNTGARQNGTLKWKLYRSLTRPFKDTSTLDLSGKFVFDARYETDKNIAHILENVCTAVLWVQKLLSRHFDQEIKIHVILREHISKLPYDIYGTLGIPIICTDNDVHGYVVQVTPHWGLDSIQPEQFNRIDIKGYNPNTPERVFIARKGNRRLSNNDEVSQFLQERGFTMYYLEDLPASEKWSICRNAKVVVAVYGAGTSNLLFNHQGLKTSDQPGSGVKLIELLSPSFCLATYRRFAPLLNGQWCAVRGQITPETLRYLDFSNKPRSPLRSPMKDPYRIDLKTLQLALDYLQIET
ncbi:MAG: glycosyltransferase family 61 protein [Synechococcales cyanobacterium M58_A2018_015]|nr:glycosyltransferase family 61 protein [Synechococcales cyanobacterium M58_A2018_015]